MSCPDVTIVFSDLAPFATWDVIQQLGMSDHFPTSCLIRKNFPELLQYSPISRWNTKKANWDRYFLEFNREHRNLPYNDIITEINRAAEQSIPKTNIDKAKQKITPKPKWWDQQCDEALKMKSIALKAYKDNVSEENFVKYKEKAAKTRRMFKSKKKKNFTTFTESLSRESSMTTVWRVINKFADANAPRARTCNNEEYINDLLNALAPPHIPQENAAHHIEWGNNEIKELKLDELIMVLSKKKNTTPGIDNISYPMLDNLPLFMKQDILNVFNKILRQEQDIPEDWKTHIVIPIKKPNKDPRYYKSYRPIALASCVGKLFESILKYRLEHFLENKNFFSQLQNGFRKGRGTTENLVYISSYIHQAFANKEIVIGVFIDIKSAYDNVSIEILYNLLHEAGIDRVTAESIRRILTERKIYIRSNNTGQLIGPQYAHKGLPQGSPLSPILFNIYTNKLKELGEDNVKTLMYADDIVLITAQRSLEQAYIAIQRKVNLLAEWLQENNLEISTDKTKAMLFSRGNRANPNYHIDILGENIEWVKEYKYLGMFLDRRLTWTKHIEESCRKAMKGINVMRALSRVWWGADPKILLNIYKGLIRSHLDYGCQAILYTSKVNLNKLDRVQFQALRLVTGCMRSTPTNALLSESAEMPLHLRRNVLCGKFILKKIVLEQDELTNSLIRLYTNYNEDPEYWRRKPTPPLLEGLDTVLSFIEYIEKYTILPCFECSYNILTSKREWIDSSINKHHPNAQHRTLELLDKHARRYEKIYTDASKDG